MTCDSNLPASITDEEVWLRAYVAAIAGLTSGERPKDIDFVSMRACRYAEKAVANFNIFLEEKKDVQSKS
jgi:hypothetical protein